MKRLIGPAVAGTILLAVLSACSGGPDAPTTAATPAASASATAGITAVSPVPSAPAASPSPASAEFCAPVDGFCIAFTDAAATDVIESAATATTTGGPLPARSYDAQNGQFVLVYTPQERDPVAALKANRDWWWSSDVTSFKGNPAILVSVTQDNPAPGDRQRDVCLKVAHGGKIYMVFAIAPEGLDSTAALRGSLRFTA